MRGHVVRSFAGVDVGELFRGNGVERGFEIDADIGVGVLIDRQGGGRVLDEDVQQADLELRQLWDGAQNVMRDQVKAAGKLGQGDASLMPSHMTFSDKWPMLRDGPYLIVHRSGTDALFTAKNDELQRDLKPQSHSQPVKMGLSPSLACELLRAAFVLPVVYRHHIRRSSQVPVATTRLGAPDERR